MNPLESHDQFEINKTRYYFVKKLPNDRLFCWRVGAETTQSGELYAARLNARELDIETLKSLKLWDNLPTEIKYDIENGINDSIAQVNEKMEKARKARKKKYVGWPEVIACIKCGAELKINKTQVAKKIEKEDLTIEQYIKDFHCQKCRPSCRGRKKKK